MLDRQLLAILREVEPLGSVTAAADRLNVTQSALSHTIRRFEERHGAALWVKKGRSLRFTQAGEHLLALAHRVLPQIEHAEEVLADFAAGRRGALRVGANCLARERSEPRRDCRRPHFLRNWGHHDETGTTEIFS